MKKVYVIDALTGKGIDQLITACEERKKWLQEKSEELARRLAEVGYETANIIMSGHVFDGDTLASLRVERIGEAQYAVKANSAAVLFLEFGSGIGGGGHPEAGDNGMGPGTYPGQSHAFDPNGWWFQTDDERLIVWRDKEGNGWGHSYGMAPAMPMYNGVKSAEQQLEALIKEVFAS